MILEAMSTVGRRRLFSMEIFRDAPTNMKELLTVREAARLLEVVGPTVLEFERAGRLKSIRTPGGVCLFDSAAVAKLAEVFQLNPLPVETAKAQYLLGSAYLGLNDLAQGLGYFEQAKNHPDYELQSKLGLVNILNSQGDKPRALTVLVEVMT